MNRAERRARTERVRQQRLRDWKRLGAAANDRVENSRLRQARHMHPLACGSPCACHHTLDMPRQELQAARRGAVEDHTLP